jgi:sec-independent protein translocase protein TatC
MSKEALSQDEEYSFWEHLEVFRWTLIRLIGVLFFFFIIVFVNYDFLFSDVILSPLSSDFITYRILQQLINLCGLPVLLPEFKIQVINYELSGQFFLQIGASFGTAALLIFPYFLLELWLFLRPALFASETKHVGRIFLFSSFLFYAGAALAYFIIFPLTIQFLGTYQVSTLIPNQISIQSYFDALCILVLCIGLTFEMPILSYFLSKMGILTSRMLSAYRKYAFVAILVLAAVITPTTDPFTMMAVALPLYLLYEVSVWLAMRNEKRANKDQELS